MLHHHSVRRALRGVAALTCAALLAACSGGGDGPAEAVDCFPPSPATTAEPTSPASSQASSQVAPTPGTAAPSLRVDDGCDEVRTTTNFGYFGRDGHLFCGVEQGIYEEHRIALTIERGGGTVPNLELLIGGQVDFTFIDLVGGALAVGAGSDGWKAVAAIHQTNLSAWMTLDPAINGPQDLEGRTIGIPFGAVTHLLFPTYLEQAGVDVSKVTIQNVAPPELGPVLVAGAVDASAQFVVGQPLFEAASEGQEVYVHPYSDYLADMIGVTLVATDELIAANPDLVRRFRAATLESLEWALDHPEECAQAQAEAVDVGGGPEVAARELELVADYVRVGTTPIGSMDSQQVARMIATLEGAEAIPPGITPQDLVAFEFAAEDAEEDQ